MVSRIAYLIASNQLKNTKKILALTFSISGAYKIKQEVTKKLPPLLQKSQSNKSKINDKLFISNYHGFCRSVLEKHGYMLSEKCREINNMSPVEDSELKFFNLENTEEQKIQEFDKKIKEQDIEYIEANLCAYNEIILEKILNHSEQGGYTFNSILSLAIELFESYPLLLKFYRKLFPIIIIDEFQDTNFLHYKLIKLLVYEKTHLLILGDSLQRIYSFLGAIPNIMELAVKDFDLSSNSLDKNYRFLDNEEMLLLDNNLRTNFKSSGNPKIEKDAKINLNYFENQNNECEYIQNLVQILIDQNSENRIAILVSSRGKDANETINYLEKANINFFYGLFTDDMSEVKAFHIKCLNIFEELITKHQFRFSPKIFDMLHQSLESIISTYPKDSKTIYKGLLQLIIAFKLKFLKDLGSLDNFDKINYIRDVLTNNGLKQFMDSVNAQIVISTIHATKGLEWDYVIIQDVEQDSIPNYRVCKDCEYKSQNCVLVINENNKSNFLESLNLLYVGATRARRKTYFTASKKNASSFSKNLSCILNIPGLSYTI
jgi:DNA helicase-2/ATP-dependent DNA helicase PcrA